MTKEIFFAKNIHLPNIALEVKYNGLNGESIKMRATQIASNDSMKEILNGSFTNLVIVNNKIGDVNKKNMIDTQLQKVKGSRYAV